LTPSRGATSGASIQTDPGQARRVIEASRRDFDARHPGLKLTPVVALVCAYEEEANIGPVLAAVPKEACGLAVTTLVVVDGGTDKTDEVAKRSDAVTFVLEENLGHGYALRVGYSLCIEFGAQYVVTLDADGQNDPAEIPVMLQPLVDDEADFVVASRILGTDTTTDNTRKAGVRVFSWIMSAMGHTKLTDTSNGYRALRVSMLDDIAYRLVQPQYQTAELLIIAMKRGWRVAERPTVWHPRASGTTKKGKNWLFGFRYGRVVVDTWWKYRRAQPHQPAG
jgi:glycosyltransferase involved in cell wall biosynthesis